MRLRNSGIFYANAQHSTAMARTVALDKTAAVTVQVENAFSVVEGAVLAGRCTFFFKDPMTEAMDGNEVVDLMHAVVPSNSVLVFRPLRSGCVSSFRVQLVVTMGDGSTQERVTERGDRSGRCWSSYKFPCGDA